LFVVFDDFAGADFGFVRVFAEFAEGPALSQQVPALIQLDLQLAQTLAVIDGELALGVKGLFFFHELVNVGENGTIVVIAWHAGSLSLWGEGLSPELQAHLALMP
jgi:hypothetical protein